MTNSTDDAPSTELETTPVVETAAAPVEADPVEAASAVEPAPVVTATPRNKKKLGLIIAGAVVAAALLFGGGIAVGTMIPGGGPGMSQGGPGGGFPGGGNGGDRPTMPGQGTQQQDGTDTENN